jgi:hypothetical protein
LYRLAFGVCVSILRRKHQTTPDMNAYLFTAITTRSQVRKTTGRYGASESFQTWDGCASGTVLGDNPDETRERFEAWLRTQPEGENPLDTEIKLVTAAQFVDKLLTESGSAPLDWPEISKQAQAQLESSAVDDFEQGYWLDVDPVIPPGQSSLSIAALQQDLPEDIRTGLNWSADRQFFYLLTVFSQPPPPPGLADGTEREATESGDPLEEDSDATGAEEELKRLLAMFPQAADKEAAALIRARNSAVAAWLWRRFAAGTPLAACAIRIDPWCGVMGLEQSQ